MPEDIIEEAIRLRTEGSYEKSIEILERSEDFSIRRNIHLAMSYIVANNSKQAVDIFSIIPNKNIPNYLSESLYVLLYIQGKLADFINIFIKAEQFYLVYIFRALSLKNYFLSTLQIANLVDSLEDDSIRRLKTVIIGSCYEFCTRMMYDKSFIGMPKDIKRFYVDLLLDEKMDTHLEEYIQDEFFCYYSCFKSITKSKPSNEIRDFASALLNIDFSSYSDRKVYDVISSIQSHAPSTIYDAFCKTIMLWYVFPIRINIVNNDFYISQLLYRHYHVVSKIVGVDVKYFIDEEEKINNEWYGSLFIRSCYEYSIKNFHQAEVLSNNCEKLIKQNLKNNEIKGLNHIGSVLCWKPSMVVQKYSNKIELPQSSCSNTIGSDICFIVGADCSYSNQFLDLFVSQVCKNENSSVFFSLFCSHANLDSNTRKIVEYSSQLPHSFWFNYNIFTESFIKDNNLRCNIDVGFYTLLRYFSLVDLMKNNPDVKYFIVTDIDCILNYSDKFVLEKIRHYDVILGAINSKDDFGVPSYIGAGSLVIRNSENGIKFASDLLNTIMNALTRVSLTYWNLDQGAIRSAVTINPNLRYGYFPRIGNVFQFANAYESKSEFINSTSKLKNVDLYPLNFI